MLRFSAVAQVMGSRKAGSAGQPTARAQLVSRSMPSSAARSSRLLAGCSTELEGRPTSNVYAICVDILSRNQLHEHIPFCPLVPPCPAPDRFTALQKPPKSSISSVSNDKRDSS